MSLREAALVDRERERGRRGHGEERKEERTTPRVGLGEKTDTVDERGESISIC